MSFLFNGFLDELLKLGGDSSPAPIQTRPVPKQTSKEMKPIDPYKTSTTGMKPIDPYKGKSDRFSITSVPRTVPRRGTAQRIRPLNAAGPTSSAITAVQPQAIKSWAKPKRVRKTTSAQFVPVAKNKVEPQSAKPVSKKSKRPGPKRLRLPGETASQFMSRRSESRKEWGEEQRKQKFPTQIESKMKRFGISRKEALSRSHGTPEYEARAKSDASKYHTRESSQASKIKSSPTTRKNIKGFLLE